GLVERISLTVRILVFVAVILVVGTAVFFIRSVLTAYEGQQKMLGVTESSRIEEFDKQLATIHKRIDRIEQQIARPKDMNSELNDSDRSSVRSLALPAKLWATYGNGVCLIAGSYILVEPSTGRPLRYSEVEDATAESLLIIGTGRQLTYEGEGAIFEQEFEATGFYVGRGYVLTNHHIALEPWAADRRTQFYIESTGATPRLKHLLAFFPGQRQPIPLTLKSSSKTDEIAVCALQSKTIPSGIPALPLDKESGALEVGKSVMTMGYPTGPDRLLALLPEKEAVGLMDQYGASLTSLLDQLAKRSLIRPMITQGHIRDLFRNRIVVDAMTTQGSSGTPMFGERGKVIGVTFAFLADDKTSNFAVGIQSAIEQLRIAGWTAPDN
ncbi:MAG TPA: serine protease, partial [Pyrinomonadaceae bacterium]